jgi:ATP synthase protein I
MKLLPKSALLPKDTRVRTDDSLGLGIEVAAIMALFFAAGCGLDWLFGTVPVFMIVMTLVGAIGMFATTWYRYEARMSVHETERTARTNALRPAASTRPDAAAETER